MYILKQFICKNSVDSIFSPFVNNYVLHRLHRLVHCKYSWVKKINHRICNLVKINNPVIAVVYRLTSVARIYRTHGWTARGPGFKIGTMIQVSISLVVTLHLRPLRSTDRAGVEPR